MIIEFSDYHMSNEFKYGLIFNDFPYFSLKVGKYKDACIYNVVQADDVDELLIWADLHNITVL